MENVTAILSLLHEAPALNSATRCFRDRPVLEWTLRRLKMTSQLDSLAIVCWEDQLATVEAIAAEQSADVLNRGPRRIGAAMHAITVARKWADGWRGGLLQTCDFDLGFDAAASREVLDNVNADALVIVNPASGLVDPKLIDNLIEHARADSTIELAFTSAAPGLGGMLLNRSLVDRLAAANIHPGRVLHYLPEQPMHDPTSGRACMAVPAMVARSTRRFTLDSDRQITHLTTAAIHLNGQLMRSDCEQLISHLNWNAALDSFPREVVIEVNLDRDTSPIFLPGRSILPPREPMTIATATKIFDELGRADDVRITLAGVGDPMCHDRIFELLSIAKEAGVSALHIETDLLPNDADAIDHLAESNVDIVSVHLPAMSGAVYKKMMSVERFAEVIDNIRRFVSRRNSRAGGGPILVPTFTKSQFNIGEMEVWYDLWLKTLGAAVINGPTDFAGLIDDCSVGFTCPPKRRACARLKSRMTILSNGRAVSCEQDVLARQPMGDLNTQSIHEIWQNPTFRSAHGAAKWNSLPTCASCSEWHRP